MRIAKQHSWPENAREGIALQQSLRSRVVRSDQIGSVTHVAGVDVGFEDDNRITRAAVAVLKFPKLEICEEAVYRCVTRFPYVPGLLSFREIPALIEALKNLSIRPDLLLCDGQGYAHPRRFGLACHLGLLTGTPAIGVAKSRLIGIHDEVEQRRGTWTPLIHNQEVIGAVLRSRTGVKPVYVSIGHKISLPTAIRYVMACTTRFRLPETTRAAHRLASFSRSARS